MAIVAGVPVHAVSDFEGRGEVSADLAPYLTSGGGEGIARMIKMTAFATIALHIIITTARGGHHRPLFHRIMAETTKRAIVTMTVFIRKDVAVNKDKV